MTRRRLAWSALAAVVLSVFLVGALRSDGARSNVERVQALSREIRCMECDTEIVSVFESRAAFAQNAREEIARQVAQGRSDSEIKAFFVNANDGSVLMTPDGGGSTSLLWVLPVLVVMCGGAGLALTFRRWKLEMRSAPSDQDRALVEQALAASLARGPMVETDEGSGR